MRWFEFITEKKHHRKRRKHNALVGIGYGFYYGGPAHTCTAGTSSDAPAGDASGGAGGGDGGGGAA